MSPKDQETQLCNVIATDPEIDDTSLNLNLRDGLKPDDLLSSIRRCVVDSWVCGFVSFSIFGESHLTATDDDDDDDYLNGSTAAAEQQTTTQF